MKRITFSWLGRTYPNGHKAQAIDEFEYHGNGGDTTKAQRLQLPVIQDETPEQQRERIRQALGRKDVHWW